MTKAILDSLFKKIQAGQLKITYWDGTTTTYGSGRLAGHLKIRDPLVGLRLLQDAELGFGDGYVHGQIEVDQLDSTLDLALANRQLFAGLARPNPLRFLARGFIQPTALEQQRADIAHHYDIGNEFFQQFLDPTLTYSSAYFESANDSLELAQRNKIRHTLAKLRLKAGERLVDIGSGWGEMIIAAAKTNRVQALGITLAEEQRTASEERIAAEKVTDQVTVQLRDYRTLAEEGEQFDKVVSVGMLEHVGRKNLPVFFDTIRAILKPGGLALIHSITHPLENPGGSWTLRYIFPGGYIPSLRELIHLLPERDLDILDVENLRPHYALTLERWADNFDRNIETVRTVLADDRLRARWGEDFSPEAFIRMWRLYLRGAAAGFRAGTVEIHQILLSKGVSDQVPLTRKDLYVK